MINAKIVNSLIQYKHHAESSHRDSVTGHSFVQRDRKRVSWPDYERLFHRASEISCS